jgi:hypothetical protein
MTVRSTPPPSRGRGRALPLVAIALALTASGLAGCQVLNAMQLYAMSGYGGWDGGDPCMSEQPSVLMVRLSHGTATMDLSTGASRHIVMSRVEGSYTDAPQDSSCGSGTGASFASVDARWSLDIEDTDPTAKSASLWLSYREGNVSYQADLSNACTATLTEVDAKGIVGTAACTRTTWFDDNGDTPGPSSSFGAPFDAKITFEARP